MSDDDRQAALALENCTFLPGSYDKRFARAMAVLARDPEAKLTEKQRTLLWRMVYRYRRQIPIARLIVQAEAMA